MIEPKAKSFYLELADLMDKHKIIEICSGDDCSVAEVRTTEFRHWEHYVNLSPAEIRSFVESAEYAT